MPVLHQVQLQPVGIHTPVQPQPLMMQDGQFLVTTAIPTPSHTARTVQDKPLSESSAAIITVNKKMQELKDKVNRIENIEKTRDIIYSQTVAYTLNERQFEAVQKLGSGSYGFVLLIKSNGKDNKKNQSALKVVRKTAVTFKNAVSERDIMLSVKNPNIVKLYESFHDEVR